MRDSSIQDYTAKVSSLISPPAMARIRPIIMTSNKMKNDTQIYIRIQKRAPTSSKIFRASIQHKSVSGHKKLIVGRRTVIGSFFINSNSRLLVNILIISFLFLVSLQAINKNTEFGNETIIQTKNPITLNSIADPVHFSVSMNIIATTKGKLFKIAQNIIQ